MPEETAAASTTESMEEKPCSSSAPDSSVDVSEEAKKLIGTGNRHLVMGDVVSAVSVFQEACAMLAEKYGDTADECGEAFFLCGKALLELARMENTVLGNALEGVPEESYEEGDKPNDSKIESADNLDEKTRDELRAQVYDAMSVDKSSEVEKEVGQEEQKMQEQVKEQDNEAKALNEDAASPKSELKAVENESKHTDDEKPVEREVQKTNGVEGALEKEDATVSNGVTKKAEKEELGTDEQSGNKENEKPMEGGGGNDDDDDDDNDDDEEAEGDAEKDCEEEVGNLQLAWEMLEVAKVIYKRKDDKEDQLMAAQIYLKLGEVGAESGNYSQALEDFNECLALQLKHLPSHSRLLAEIHYQLGTTYSYTAQYSQAIEHFSNSIEVIESRLAMLQEVIKKAEDAEAAQVETSELEELKRLLPEITEKIDDAKESQRTAAIASEAIHQTLARASASSAFPSENGGPSSSGASQIAVRPPDGASSKSASDISHLVRKKRKPDEESPKKDSDAKKTKPETSVNGSCDSAHNSNGVQEKIEHEATNSSTVEMSA
ncbi:histone-binding protein N1/N2-like isoform X3 [Xyrauchen texanus]|uniref:histone-binding protein N1/N2-like isoform X3 n=1 Tax=Xyrauchen texanus TaxID=154827 RepID=UPI002241BEE3|nr:histone-binding protein N1/N2-like isoform X3 [Xyrauchen texanus]